MAGLSPHFRLSSPARTWFVILRFHLFFTFPDASSSRVTCPRVPLHRPDPQQNWIASSEYRAGLFSFELFSVQKNCRWENCWSCRPLSSTWTTWGRKRNSSTLISQLKYSKSSKELLLKLIFISTDDRDNWKTVGRCCPWSTTLFWHRGQRPHFISFSGIAEILICLLQNLLNFPFWIWKYFFLQFALDDGVVNAHKPLLMARCDMMQVSVAQVWKQCGSDNNWLQAMFSDSFRESSARCVRFPGVTCATFRSLLHFLYTGRISYLSQICVFLHTRDWFKFRWRPINQNYHNNDRRCLSQTQPQHSPRRRPCRCSSLQTGQKQIFLCCLRKQDIFWKSGIIIDQSQSFIIFRLTLTCSSQAGPSTTGLTGGDWHHWPAYEGGSDFLEFGHQHNALRWWNKEAMSASRPSHFFSLARWVQSQGYFGCFKKAIPVTGIPRFPLERSLNP